MSYWISGPALVAWMEQHHVQAPMDYSSKMGMWREGALVSERSVDALLCEIGTHSLHDLPEELYVESPSARSQRRMATRGRRGRKPIYPPELHREVLAAIETGDLSLRAASKRFHIARKTIKRWQASDHARAG